MKFSKFTAERDNQRNEILFMRIALAGLVLALLANAGASLTVAGSERTILVPPEIHQSFWVSGQKVSVEYLKEMAYWYAGLALNITPHVADFQKEYGRLPSLYASQGFDAALLIDGAVRDVKGRLDDKEALRKALEAKHFKSVRGDFKFNSNHYPVQNYYLRVIGRDAQGRITNKTMGTVFTNHADAYVAQCKMK